ncbi:hypothetical protein [Spirosoma aerolatum]|uniref:hypothetical protein n=1 Tax=Spirosoma aerolatum TaxID=1211326 RepID=UPI0009AE8D39|nr:hypothetical protein [Spirosoma aerolatum]
MKSLPAIGFLILLLYHWLGLPLAVLTFEQSYQEVSQRSATDEFKLVKLPISLPYTAAWENPDGQEGLIQDGDTFYNIVQQRYANDTLYTLLKTNQNARERFFELAEQWQQLSDDQNDAQSPLGRLLKLISERLTTYLPPFFCQLDQPVVRSLACVLQFPNMLAARYQLDRSPVSPPPQA